MDIVSALLKKGENEAVSVLWTSEHKPEQKRKSQSTSFQKHFVKSALFCYLADYTYLQLHFLGTSKLIVICNTGELLLYMMQVLRIALDHF